MDLLETIWSRQADFESLFVDLQRAQEDSAYLDHTADYLSTSLAREAFEFKDEFNWKEHAAVKPHDRKAQVEEAMDCFIFSIDQLLILGVTAEEAFSAYCHKNLKNWDRQVDRGNAKAIDSYPAYLSERG